MLNKFTIIGLIIGSVISLLGVSSMIDSLSNPDEVQEDSQIFGVGDMDKIQFNAPENSSQSITIIGDSFDVKISTPDSSNDIDQSFKGKANLSWTSVTSGETIIIIQNTGDSEFTENFEKLTEFASSAGGEGSRVTTASCTASCTARARCSQRAW